MKLLISSTSLGNPRVTFSRLGYHVEKNGSFARRVGGSLFPRFHVYIKEVGDKREIDIHLDMSQYTLQGVRTHKGEYDGELVEKEVTRLKNSFSKST